MSKFKPLPVPKVDRPFWIEGYIPIRTVRQMFNRWDIVSIRHRNNGTGWFTFVKIRV